MLRDQIIAAIGQHLPDSPERLTVANRESLRQLNISEGAWRKFAAHGSEIRLSTIQAALRELGFHLCDRNGHPVIAEESP